jgi:membrane fusion protein
MTTNTPEHPFFRPAAVAAASGTKFAGAIVLAQPGPMRIAACAAGAITIALALLLTCGHYTRKVRVTGQMVPAAGSIKVVAPAFGRITRSLVEDGARVAAGQALFELTAERASGGGAVDERIDGLLTVRRDEREQTRQLQIDELKRRAQALAARRDSIEAEIATRSQEIALQDAQVQHARDKLQRYAKLAKRGFVSRTQLDDVSAELAAQQARRKALEGSLLSIRRDLLDVQEEVRGIDGKVALIASQARQDVAIVEQEAAEHEGRSRVRVVAPIAGTVTALASETGQTVPGGAPLATVLPTGSRLEARLLVPSRGIAFVAVGQHVLLRVDAFPYQKFGQIEAVVVAVEQAPISDGAGAPTLYRVTVRPDRQSVLAYGHEQQFKTGMTLEADILQDRRRLIEWLVEPLVSVAKGRAH